MDKYRVEVAGGTGFVGQWMKCTQPETVSANYLSRKQYSYLSTAARCEAIVHLPNSDPSWSIEFAKKNGLRLLYCSSGIVYHSEWDTEYRHNKIKWEQDCLDSGVDVVIARLFTFFGDGLDANKAISKFTLAAKSNQPIHVTGGGRTIRSYMHGEDLGRWMWAILLKGESGQAYDVGDDNPINMFDLAQLVKKSCDSSSDIIVSDDPDPMPVYLPPNTAKTKKLLMG